MVVRFGHDWDPQCMEMDETLASVAEKVKNYSVIYLVDISEAGRAPLHPTSPHPTPPLPLRWDALQYIKTVSSSFMFTLPWNMAHRQ